MVVATAMAMVIATSMTKKFARTTMTVRTTMMAIVAAVAAAFLPDRQQSTKCSSGRNGVGDGDSNGNGNGDGDSNHNDDVY